MMELFSTQKFHRRFLMDVFDSLHGHCVFTKGLVLNAYYTLFLFSPFGNYSSLIQMLHILKHIISWLVGNTNHKTTTVEWTENIYEIGDPTYMELVHVHTQKLHEQVFLILDHS